MRRFSNETPSFFDRGIIAARGPEKADLHEQENR